MARAGRSGSTVDLLDALALAMPQVAKGTSWGDRPSYLVGGKPFILWRGPRKDALDEAGERLPDVVMFAVPTAEDKQAVLAGGPPWFTTDHFNGYNAVLVRECHLDQVTRDELAEMVQDAWLAKAPKRLAKEWLADLT